MARRRQPLVFTSPALLCLPPQLPPSPVAPVTHWARLGSHSGANFTSCLLRCELNLFLSLPPPPPQLFCVHADVSIPADPKSRVTESSQSPGFRVRTESEQVPLYSPERSSLHESEGLLLPSLHLLFSTLPVLFFFLFFLNKVAMSSVFLFSSRRLWFVIPFFYLIRFSLQGLQETPTAQLR